MTPGEHARPRQGEKVSSVKVTAFRLGAVELAVIALPPSDGAPNLTPAERAIAKLVLDGCSNNEIAARRGASVKTVANQLRALYQKLGINSRYELAARLGT